MGQAGNAPQIVAVTSVMLGMLTYGFHLGWPSPTLHKLLDENSDLPVTSAQGSWIVGFFMIGSVCMTLFCPVLTDRWGRRTIILFSSIPSCAGNVIIIFAPSYQWLYVARFVIGLGAGMALIPVLMYAGEITDDRLRGAVGSLFNIIINLGLAIAYCVGPWVDKKTLAAIGAVMPVIFALIFFWMPESPYYLLIKKKYDDVRKSLIWLRGTADVTEELKTIEQNVEFEKQNTGSYKELFVIPENRRAVIITIGLVLAQQFSGIGAINAYSSLIFEASGSQLSTNTSLIIISLIQLLSGFFGIFIARLGGRRQLLMISIGGLVFFLSCEALYFQLKAAGIDVTSVFWLPITAIVGFLIFYTLGLGILPNSIYAAIFCCNVKAKGIMLTNINGYLGLIFVTQIHQVIVDSYGVEYAFWFFAASSICSANFVYFLVPETKDRSFREIQDELRSITRSNLALQI